MGSEGQLSAPCTAAAPGKVSPDNSAPGNSAPSEAAPSKAAPRIRLGAGVWLVAVGAAIWGTDAVFRLTLLKQFTSLQIVFMEHLLLALYAVPAVVIGWRQIRRLQARYWAAVLFISWGGSALATSLFTVAFEYGNPTVVLLLQKLQPLFALILAQLLLKESLPRRFALYLVVALFGTYLLTFGFQPVDLHGISHGIVVGSLLSLGAASLWGGSTVMGRIVLNKLNFETVTGLRFLLALPFMAVLVWQSPTGFHNMFAHTTNLNTLSNLIMQAFLPGLLSLLLYYRGLSNTKASFATLAELAFPAAALLINWVFFRVGLSWGQVAGLIAIWLVVFRLSRYAQQS